MEEWKDKVMDSLQGMEKAQPKQELFDTIHKQITKKQDHMIELPLPQWLSAAAVLLMILVVNVYLLSQRFTENTSQKQTEQMYIGSASDYNLYEQ